MPHHAMTREQALKALELHADASFQEIKQAYRDLALVWHPDRFAHSTRLQEKASERLRQINIAYDVLRSYADGPSGAHEPRTKHTGSKHGTSGTEQSETQRQRSRTKDRGARPSAEHTESQNQRNRGDHSRQPLRRAWVVLAALLFVAVIAGLLNDRPTDAPQDHQEAAKWLRKAAEQGVAVAQNLLGSMYRSGEGVPQDYQPITRPDEVGAPAADTVTSSPADLETDSANPVLAAREPEADASGSTDLYGTFTRGSHQDDVLRIQGTPSSINSYPGLGHEVWKYGYSTINISLRNRRVTEWSNSGNLKVRMDAGPNVTNDETFTRGSHGDDVLRIQGTPSSINSYPGLGHEVWKYGYSTIDISLRNGRVTEWSNQGNLKVRLDAGTGPGEGGGIDREVFRVGGGVSAPQVIFKVDPEYTEQARKAKLQGTVVLNLLVQRDGTVRNVRVVQSLDLGLDEKAIEAVQKWRFRPGMKSGEPVDVAAIIEVTFRLL